MPSGIGADHGRYGREWFLRRCQYIDLGFLIHGHKTQACLIVEEGFSLHSRPCLINRSLCFIPFFSVGKMAGKRAREVEHLHPSNPFFLLRSKETA